MHKYAYIAEIIHIFEQNIIKVQKRVNMMRLTLFEKSEKLGSTIYTNCIKIVELVEF